MDRRVGAFWPSNRHRSLDSWGGPTPRLEGGPKMRALTKTTKRTIILGLAAFGLMAGVAVATPGFLVSASTPVRGTIAEPFKVETDGLVELKTKGPIDVAD